MNYEDEYIILDEITPFYKKKFLGKGCSGECYLTEDNQVFKELYNNNQDFYSLKTFTHVKNDSVVFPNKIVYLKEKNDENIIGYLMDYVDGYLFKDIPLNEKIDYLINASIKAEKDILALSFEKAIIMEEINTANVIYSSDNRFKIIDTDFYTYFPSEEETIIYRTNMHEWGNYMMSVLVTDYPFKYDEINYLYEDCVLNGRVKPSLIISKIKEILETESNKKINTLDEYQNNLKLIKKMK